MRELEDYMEMPHRMEVIADDEGGYVVSFPELKGCLTSGETIESAIANAREAKREWILAALEEGYSIPAPERDEDYSGQFKLRIPKSLHRRLAEQSRREGISMNQYCLYLLSRGDALSTHRS